LPICGLESLGLELLGREEGCKRPYSSSANDRSIGAEACVDGLEVASVFQFVLGTGGRVGVVDGWDFLWRGSAASLFWGFVVLFQSGTSGGCWSSHVSKGGLDQGRYQ
jgi:hypothetical protein